MSYRAIILFLMLPFIGLSQDTPPLSGGGTADHFHISGDGGINSISGSWSHSVPFVKTTRCYITYTDPEEGLIEGQEAEMSEVGHLIIRSEPMMVIYLDDPPPGARQMGDSHYYEEFINSSEWVPSGPPKITIVYLDNTNSDIGQFIIQEIPMDWIEEIHLLIGY